MLEPEERMLLLSHKEFNIGWFTSIVEGRFKVEYFLNPGEVTINEVAIWLINYDPSILKKKSYSKQMVRSSIKSVEFHGFWNSFGDWLAEPFVDVQGVNFSDLIIPLYGNFLEIGQVD